MSRLFIQDPESKLSCFSELQTLDHIKKMFTVDYELSADPRDSYDLLSEMGGFNMMGSVKDRLYERRFNEPLSTFRFDPSFRLFEGFDFASWSHKNSNLPFFNKEQECDLEFVYLMLKMAIGVDPEFCKEFKKSLSRTTPKVGWRSMISAAGGGMIFQKVESRFFKDRVFFFDDLPYAYCCITSLALKGSHVYYKQFPLPSYAVQNYLKRKDATSFAEGIAFKVLEEIK